MKSLFLVIAVLLSLGITAVAATAELSPDQVYSFADRLYGEGDYYRAITEYERFLFFFPDHPLAKTARYQIGMSYFLGDRLADAIRSFQDVAERYPNDEVGKQAQIRIGEAYAEKHDYVRARAAYERVLRTFPDDPDSDGVRIKIGWCYLRQGDWQQAETIFNRIPETSSLREQAQWLAGQARMYPDVADKSPVLAGGLSAVLPGAGQLYVGRKRDALLAFFMNGAFLWATIEAYHNHSTTTAGVLLFFESGWYFGNVYGAVGSTYKHNRDRQQEHLDRMSNQYGISIFRDDRRNAMVALTVRF